MGFLRYDDIIVMNTKEILLVAIKKAQLIVLAGYQPPLKQRVPVFGETGIATIKALLANMRDGNQISEHDYKIAVNLADTMCGGQIEKDTEVSEDWLLEKELINFKELAVSEKTEARMKYMLETGKPLRNQGVIVMSENVYIVAAKRSAVTKGKKGGFAKKRPDELLADVLKKTVAKSNINPNNIEDIVVGCAMPEAEQGLNVARISSLLAELPNTVPSFTINRYCSSGLQSIAIAANEIAQGNIDVAIGAGVESMSMIPFGGNKMSFSKEIFAKDENVAIAYGMGITAEMVAKDWNVSRQDQDAFALESHQKAINAIENGYFKDEILPIDVDQRYFFRSSD